MVFVHNLSLSSPVNDAIRYRWSTNQVLTGASDLYDGVTNTQTLTVSPNAINIAANVCVGVGTGWYLPAICELGTYLQFGADPGCAANTPNILTNLVAK